MGHEGSAQTCAKDEIVAERVEALGILERGSLRRSSRLAHHEAEPALGPGSGMASLPTALSGMSEVDRTRRRQLAAEEFLRHCEAQKAEERERERVVDDAAEELLQEQLKLEASTKRNRTIRWLLDSFSKMLPGPLRRSLSPLRERFPVEAKITHADVRARKQGGRSRTVSGVTAANLFSAASSRGQKR